MRYISSTEVITNILDNFSMLLGPLNGDYPDFRICFEKKVDSFENLKRKKNCSSIFIFFKIINYSKSIKVQYKVLFIVWKLQKKIHVQSKFLDNFCPKYVVYFFVTDSIDYINCNLKKSDDEGSSVNLQLLREIHCRRHGNIIVTLKNNL